MIEIAASLIIFLTFIVCSFIASKKNLLPNLDKSSINKRYYFLDGLRGLAAAAVINAHIWRLAINDVNFNNFNIYSKHNEFFGSFGVQIFFCITGFLFTDQAIKKRYKFEWDRFFLSRVKRLVPLYFFTIAVCLLIILLLGNSLPTLRDTYNSLRLFSFGFYGNGSNFKILDIKPDILTASIWTLAYEWRFYLLMPIMCIVFSSRYKSIGIVVVFLYMILGIFTESFNVWVYFSTGALSAIIFNKIIIKNQIFRFSILCVGFVSLFLYFFLSHDTYGQASFLLISLFFICIILSRPRILGWMSLVYLGEISYSVYLNHLIVIYASGKLIKYMQPADYYNPIICYSIVALLTFALSIITYKYIEYPFIRKKAP